MNFFPVALVQKTVPEIRGIFVVGSNLKKKGKRVFAGSWSILMLRVLLVLEAHNYVEIAGPMLRKAGKGVL
jgi:hypothetical protein